MSHRVPRPLRPRSSLAKRLTRRLLPTGLRVLEDDSGSLVVVTDEDIADRQWAGSLSPVIVDGHAVDASVRAAERLGGSAEELFGDLRQIDGFEPELVKGQLRGLDVDELRAKVDAVSHRAVETVTAALETDPVGAEHLPQLRRLAAEALPARLSYRDADEGCVLAWLDPDEVVYAMYAPGEPVPVYWVAYPGDARFAGNPSGQLHQVNIQPEALLVQLGGSALLDPRLLRPTPVDVGGKRSLIDPITMEDWTPSPGEIESASVLRAAPPVTARSPRTTFVLIGGAARVAIHTGTFDIPNTGELSEVDSWILADRMIESEDWYKAALEVALGLISGEGDAFGIVWRCPHVAGPAIKVGRRVTGSQFREVKMNHDYESDAGMGRAVTHDLVQPEERWVWARANFTPPVLKQATNAVSRGWESAGTTDFSAQPDVLVIGRVDLDATHAGVINACQPRIVVSVDVPHMRSFVTRFRSGGKFRYTDQIPPRLASYKWKRVERGAVTASDFGATWQLGAGDHNPRLIEAVIRYLASHDTEIDPLRALDDPVVSTVAQRHVRQLSSAFEDHRPTVANERALHPYRDAWAVRGGCMFYEPARNRR